MKDMYFPIKRGIEKVCNIYQSVGEALYNDPRERLVQEIMKIVKQETDSLNDQIHSLESENARLKALLGKETIDVIREDDKYTTICADCGGCGAHYVSRHGYRLCWDCMIKEGEFHIVDGIKMRTMGKLCTCRMDADEPARDCPVHHGA